MTRLSVIVPLAVIVLNASAASAQLLGSARNFGVLDATTVTNTDATIITGDVGVSPGTAITGFLLTNTIVGPGTVTAGLGLVNGTIVHGQTLSVQQPPPVQQAPTVATPPVATMDAAPVPTPAPCPSLPPGLSDIGPMVNHISDLVNQAIGHASASVKVAQVATTSAGGAGGTTSKVTIERDKLDEIRAELELIKAIVKK